MKCKAELPYWSEEGAKMQVEHLKDVVQMIIVVQKTELDISDSTIKSKTLQCISKGGQYEVHHFTSPHVLCQMNLARNFDIVTRHCPFSDRNLFKKVLTLQGISPRG